MDKRLQELKDLRVCLAAILIALVTSTGMGAVPRSQGRITGAKKDVRVVGNDGVPRRAAVNQELSAGVTLQTDAGSSAEVTFANNTIARLAANTALMVGTGTRELKLNGGAILLQAPKSARGVRVHADDVVATVTGTTVMLEHHPGMYKFLVLQGQSRLYRPTHLGDSILVNSGQMVIGDAEPRLRDPVDVDIGRFIRTSHFITDFSSLPGEAAIVAASQKQERQKSKKHLLDTNLVIFGGGTEVSLVDPEETEPAAQGNTAQTRTPGAKAISGAAGRTGSQPSPTPK